MASSKDPVCGMTVRPDTPHRYLLRGVDYRFCSEKCLAKFQAFPNEYLDATQETLHAAQEAPSAGVLYTCPMHPEIVR